VEPRCNEVPKDWQIVFVSQWGRYIGGLFHTFYYYWAKEYNLSSLYRGLRYTGVLYNGVRLKIYINLVPRTLKKGKVLGTRLDLNYFCIHQTSGWCFSRALIGHSNSG